MPRRHRFVPEGPVVVAVMTRCHQSRCFLVKTREAHTRALYLGVWAHALATHPEVKLASLVTQPNHYHALLILERGAPELLSDFMGLVNGNLARELNRQLGRVGTFWGARYSASLVAPSAYLARLRYDHSNGVKSGDYRHPSDNPLPNTTDALRFGHGLQGRWVRRAELAAARARGGRVPESAFTDVLDLPLAPLPVGLDGLRDYQALMRREVALAAESGRAERDARGIRLRKLRVLLRLDPMTRPESSKQGRSAPLAFGTPDETRPLWVAYRQMRAAQLGALKRLAGHLAPWPEPAHRPPPLRMAARVLATEGSALAG